MNRHILTPEGVKKIKCELQELKAKRKPIIGRIARAKELGDLSENAEYQAAREEQSFNEGRIRELEFILADAQIVTPTISTGAVSLGSIVTLVRGNQKISYHVVGFNEASIKENKISIDSPIARAMLGKKGGR